MWRFKTKDEFIKEGLWNGTAPRDWNYEGKMDKYLGQKIPKKLWKKCNKSNNIDLDSWVFGKYDYIFDATSQEPNYEIY